MYMCLLHISQEVDRSTLGSPRVFMLVTGLLLLVAIIERIILLLTIPRTLRDSDSTL
jgi:hypothetical protein